MTPKYKFAYGVNSDEQLRDKKVDSIRCREICLGKIETQFEANS